MIGIHYFIDARLMNKRTGYCKAQLSQRTGMAYNGPLAKVVPGWTVSVLDVYTARKYKAAVMSVVGDWITLEVDWSKPDAWPGDIPMRIYREEAA